VLSADQAGQPLPRQAVARRRLEAGEVLHDAALRQRGVQVGKGVGRSEVDVGDGVGRPDQPARWRGRVLDRVFGLLAEDLGVTVRPGASTGCLADCSSCRPGTRTAARGW